MKKRSIFVLAVVAGVLALIYYVLLYVPKHKRAGEPVFITPKYVLTFDPIQPIGSPAYVLPESLQVWNTPAIIRFEVRTLKSGDQVYELGRYHDWAKIRLSDGETGWVAEGSLMEEATYKTDQQLLSQIEAIPPQAAGHPEHEANIHLEPAREAPLVAQLKSGDKLEIFARRLVARSAQAPSSPDGIAIATPLKDAWYLVRTKARAGWILGRLVDLDIPPAIESHAQSMNLVAWLVLNQVNDTGGRLIPQYVVADRVGTDTCDFNHVRVLTWWQRKQTYAVAYVEGNLQGYFPVLVSREGATPYFRLRLVDSDGTKYQKVYGLFDTMTRVIGTVPGWESDAAPEPLPPRSKRLETTGRRPSGPGRH